MKMGYDIFRKLDDGSPMWIAQADSLGKAQQTVKSLKSTSPGRYFVRDAETGRVIADPDDGKS